MFCQIHCLGPFQSRRAQFPLVIVSLLACRPPSSASSLKWCRTLSWNPEECTYVCDHTERRGRAISTMSPWMTSDRFSKDVPRSLVYCVLCSLLAATGGRRTVRREIRVRWVMLEDCCWALHSLGGGGARDCGCADPKWWVSLGLHSFWLNTLASNFGIFRGKQFEIWGGSPNVRRTRGTIRFDLESCQPISITGRLSKRT